MKRKAISAVIASLVVVGAAGTAESQTPTPTPQPRLPIVLLRTQGTGSSPSTTPGPQGVDPTGTYQGSASVTVSDVAFGQNLYYTQEWQLDLKTQPCLDCDPNVYYLDGTSFRALDESSNGTAEKGGIRGFLGANGVFQGLTFFVANCPFVLEQTANENITHYDGGNFGDVHGTSLVLRDGLITGTVSGRDCLSRAFTASVSLRKTSSGPVLSCDSGAVSAGNYILSVQNSCGVTLNGPVGIVASGCILSGVQAEFGAMEFAMTGPNSFAFRVQDVGGPCRTSNVTGTGTINGDGTLIGTWSGTSQGGAGCCPAGPINGSLSLLPI
jgi:hypothetical protein